MKHTDYIKGTIGICLMSWKNPYILARTLDTYLAQELFDVVDDHLILFQEVGNEEIMLARDYGLHFITTENNLGIYGGVKLLAESIKTDYVLLLEDDCPLIEDKLEVQRQLTLAKERLSKNEVQVYRLRSRKEPGEKFDTVEKYKKYYPLPGEPFSIIKSLRCLIRPQKCQRLMGSALYVHEEVDEEPYKKFITKQPEGDYIVSSKVMNWTNQSVLCKREWLLNTVLRYAYEHPSRRTVNGFQDIEKSLNCSWWREQAFKIGVSKGLFTHRRLEL